MVDKNKVLELKNFFHCFFRYYEENFDRIGHHATFTLLLYDFINFSLFYLAVNNEWTDEKIFCIESIFDFEDLILPIDECKNSIICKTRSFLNYFPVSFKIVVNVDNLLGEYLHTTLYCKLIIKLIKLFNDSFDDIEIEKTQRGLELIEDLRSFAYESLIRCEEFNSRR